MLATRPAGAEPVATWLQVERAAGSEACPQTEDVFAAIARLFPERDIRQSDDAARSDASAHIEIRPTSEGHVAIVNVTLPRPGQRVILANDAACTGLGDALAVALTGLVDPAADEADSAPGRKPLTAPCPSTAPPRDETKSLRETLVASPPESDRRTQAPPPFRVEAEGAAVGGLGLLSEPAWGAAFGFDVVHTRGFGFTLQGLRLWSPAREAEGGRITLTLWAALAGASYRVRLGPSSSIDAGLSLGAGRQYAEVQGFSAPRSGGYPWMVLAPLLRYHRRVAELLDATVALGGTGQLQRQSYSVSLNDGTDARAEVAPAPTLGVIAELGLTFGSSVF